MERIGGGGLIGFGSWSRGGDGEVIIDNGAGIAPPLKVVGTNKKRERNYLSHLAFRLGVCGGK